MARFDFDLEFKGVYLKKYQLPNYRNCTLKRVL